MTTRLKVSHQGPLNTHDAAYSYDDDETADREAVGRIISGAQNSLGIFAAPDIAAISSILEKYVCGSGVTNATGVTRAGDAADAGREAAVAVARNIARNREVADGYREFWNKKNAELHRFGVRGS